MVSDQKLESTVKLDLLLGVMGGTIVAVGSSGGSWLAGGQSKLHFRGRGKLRAHPLYDLKQRGANVSMEMGHAQQSICCQSSQQ